MRLRRAALALALLSTLAFWPPALDRWSLAKVLVLGVAAVLAVFPAPSGRLPRWLTIALAAAAVLLVLAAVAGGQPLAALMGRWPRYEGLVTATSYLLALWIGARVLGPASEPRDLRVLDRALALVGGVLAAVSIAEAMGLRPLPSNLDRPGALLGNATDQGAVAAAVAIVLFARILNTRRIPNGRRGRIETALLATAAGLAGLTVILSGSRAALLALLIGAVAAAALAPVAALRRLVLAAVSAAPVAVLGLLIPSMGSRLLGASPLPDRLLIWGDSLRVAAAHPLLGVGPSGFLDAVAAVHDVRWFTSVADGSVLDSPHDVLLQAFVVGGPAALLGLLAALAAVTVAVVRRVRTAHPERRGILVPAALGAGVLLLVLLTHVSSPSTVIPAALLLGAAVSVARPEPLPDPLPLRVGWGLGIAAWLALVTVTLAGEAAVASGVAAAREGRIADADAAFESAVELRLWDADTPMIAAEAFTARLDSGDRTALRPATEWAERAHTLAPNSLAVGKALVTTAIARNVLKDAEPVLADLREHYPLDPWVAHRAGAVAVAQGRLDEGEQLLKLAIELDPQRPEPWLTLAYLYEQRGDGGAAADAQAQAAALSR